MGEMGWPEPRNKRVAHLKYTNRGRKRLKGGGYGGSGQK